MLTDIACELCGQSINCERHKTGRYITRCPTRECDNLTVGIAKTIEESIGDYEMRYCVECCGTGYTTPEQSTKSYECSFCRPGDKYV